MTASHRTHRRIAGACMILAPLLLLVSAILQPQLKDGEIAQLAIVKGNLDRWFTTQAFALAAIALAVPAVLGLMHMLRERRSTAANVGGGLALLGLLAVTGTVAINLVAWEMMRFGIPIPQTAAVLKDAKDTAGISIPFVILPFALAAGLVVLAAAHAAARTLNPAMAALVAIGGVVLLIGYAIASDAIVIVGAASLFAGLATTGLMVLAETDEQWEHAPRFHGLRPAASA